jgi:membrane fusion protein (multidrug efflux system)
VRIGLDPQELAAHPLQIGLSMQVEVDTRQRAGDRLPQLGQSAQAVETDVFHSLGEVADARVKAIIAANERGAALPPADLARSTAAPETIGARTLARSAHPAATLNGRPL